MEESQSPAHSHSHHSSYENASSHVTDHAADSAGGGGSDFYGTSPASFSGAGPVGSISGAKYRLMSPAKLPISRSPCIAIPPGLSPTSFLESPVLLSNIKAEPSPTTGSFFKPQLMQGSGETAAPPLTKQGSGSSTVDEKTSSSFEFQFHTGSSSGSALSSSGLMHPIHLNRQQNGPYSQVQDQRLMQPPAMSSLFTSEPPSSNELRLSAPTSTNPQSVSGTIDEIDHGDHSKAGIQASSIDHKESASSVTNDRTSDDGYNWRKYGQKLVKGSEFPRSYYKCTYPNCEVKKIFERSPSGQITEIVYKGSHDHPRPQPARRYNSGALMPIQEEKDKDLLFTGQDDKLNSSTPNSNLEANASPALSPLQANEDGQDINDDMDEEDPLSKRRKIEDCLDVTPVVKPIREPRVVVQTVSEVDILDDGYRWRKYGQKVVRGNPNPRSYYKCTSAGCPVRKHVERASHDPKAVITTYEGKHNHDVPTARNSSHEFAGPTQSGNSRIMLEDNSSISLDLGVGINKILGNRTSGQVHSFDAETARSQIPSSNSSMMGIQTQVPGAYGIMNGGLNLYGSREHHIEGHSFQAPPVHPSNQYASNLGRIPMGQ